MMRPLARGMRALAGAALAALALLGVQAPASAAEPPILISSDGVTYSATYPGGLFDGVVVVPATSHERSFWVRNNGSTGANLAVAVRGVVSARADLVESLTIRAQSPSRVGPGVGLDDVGACASLLTGVHLEAGSSVKVDVELAMLNVSGTTGQGAQADFDLVIQLTSDVAPAPSGCPGTPSEPPPPPPTPQPSPSAEPSPSTEPSAGPSPAPTPTDGGTDGRPDNGGEPMPEPVAVVIPGFGGGEPEPAPTPTDEPEPEAPAGPSDGSPDGPGGESAGTSIEVNTDRFYQEWFVMAWVIELVLGGLAAGWVLRRRQTPGER